MIMLFIISESMGLNLTKLWQHASVQEVSSSNPNSVAF